MARPGSPEPPPGTVTSAFHDLAGAVAGVGLGWAAALAALAGAALEADPR